MRVEGVGKVSLINLVDVTSRLKAESYPSLETTNPALPDYQLTDTASVLNVWLARDPDAGPRHRLLRSYDPFPFSHAAAFVVARVGSAGALHSASAVPPITPTLFALIRR